MRNLRLLGKLQIKLDKLKYTTVYPIQRSMNDFHYLLILYKPLTKDSSTDEQGNNKILVSSAGSIDEDGKIWNVPPLLRQNLDKYEDEIKGTVSLTASNKLNRLKTLRDQSTDLKDYVKRLSRLFLKTRTAENRYIILNGVNGLFTGNTPCLYTLDVYNEADNPNKYDFQLFNVSMTAKDTWYTIKCDLNPYINGMHQVAFTKTEVNLIYDILSHRPEGYALVNQAIAGTKLLTDDLLKKIHKESENY